MFQHQVPDGYRSVSVSGRYALFVLGSYCPARDRPGQLLSTVAGGIPLRPFDILPTRAIHFSTSFLRLHCAWRLRLSPYAPYDPLTLPTFTCPAPTPDRALPSLVAPVGCNSPTV